VEESAATRVATPEDMVVKLCQVDVLAGQGLAITDAVERAGLTLATYLDWRDQVEHLKRDEFIRLQLLKVENAELERAVLDLTLRIASLRRSAADARSAARELHPALAPPRPAQSPGARDWGEP
jgi:putative transposase